MSADDGAYEVLDATGCKSLKKGLVIAKLGGLDLKTEGARAFDYLVAQCRDGKDIELQGRAEAAGSVVRVPCHATLATRPAYERVTGAPGVR